MPRGVGYRRIGKGGSRTPSAPSQSELGRALFVQRVYLLGHASPSPAAAPTRSPLARHAPLLDDDYLFRFCLAEGAGDAAASVVA